MKFKTYILGISVIGLIYINGLIISNLHGGVTTVNRNELFKEYNDLINSNGIERLIMNDKSITLEI